MSLAAVRTHRDIYPTGRKHCSRCKRWRPVSDFGVRIWADEPYCTIPRSFRSMCAPCVAAKKRERTGYKPRNWYPNGAPGSERHRLNINANNRSTRETSRQDEEWRERTNEYHRIWRHAKNGGEGTKKVTEERTLVDGKPLLEWLDGMTEVALTDTEAQTIARLRSGTRKLVTHAMVDRIMTRNGCVDQVAVFYPLEED